MDHEQRCCMLTRYAYLTKNTHNQISTIHTISLWTQPINLVRLDDQRGKWAARTISFELNGADSLPDGTPLGGSIVWNSKRLFPREQPGIRIIDIARVEHSDQVSGRKQKSRRD